MKITRPVLAVALGASVALAGPSSAAIKKPAPKPVCNLLTDAPSDASLQPPLPASQSLDIVSADLATDKRNITAAIRVKKLAATDPTTAPTGSSWTFSFAADDVVFSLHANSDVTGKITYTASSLGPNDKIGKLVVDGSSGVFDLAKNEIRITTPASTFASELTLKDGKALTDLEATSAWSIAVGAKGVGSASYSIAIDDGASDKTYKAGQLSCVKPGK